MCPDIPKTSPPPRRRWYAKVTRDLVLFAVGLVLLINEALLRPGDPRESLLIVYAGMMGLPAILQAEFLRKKNGGDG